MDTELTPLDMDRMRRAAEMLLEARRTLEPITGLPLELRPHSISEAYAIQDVIAEAMGPIGGWKVAAATLGAQPIFAPMPLLGGFGISGVRIASSLSRMRGVEAEMAFVLAHDLPVRPTVYSRDEVVEAIGGCHPAIEVLETAFEDPDGVEKPSLFADLLMNGGFVYGAACPSWQSTDLRAEMASMSVDGAVRVESHAPEGFDPVRLLIWLANQGQSRTGGLNAGDWITTGSWTGKVLANSGSEAVARFTSLGEVRVRFE
ncbi:MAG TPA: fumarylacetoacetate hydrolase family protein [Acidisarcina sp.]